MFSIYEYIIDIREGCGEQMLSNFESHAFQKYSKCWVFIKPFCIFSFVFFTFNTGK